MQLNRRLRVISLGLVYWFRSYPQMPIGVGMRDFCEIRQRDLSGS